MKNLPIVLACAGWMLAATTLAMGQVKLGEPAPDREKERLQAIGRAKAQLSLELKVAESQLVLESATAATWPDASLGCPQKDRMYAQVVTRGWKILLRAGGTPHEVRVAGKRAVVCDRAPGGDPARE